MTKISIDVDFNKDPEVILKEIQDKAKAEVEKREKKERVGAHLEKLHSKVNEAIGTSYGNVNDLIRALAAYATPALRDRITGVTSSGRRKTVTMTNDLFRKIKTSLGEDGKSKAEIARDVGVSTSQVTKVECGGYDSKFDSSSSGAPSSSDSTGQDETEDDSTDEGSQSMPDQAELSIPDLEPKQEELPMPGSLPAPAPPDPLAGDETAPAAEETAPPTSPFGEEGPAISPSDEVADESLGSFEDAVPDAPAPTIPSMSSDPVPEGIVPPAPEGIVPPAPGDEADSADAPGTDSPPLPPPGPDVSSSDESSADSETADEPPSLDATIPEPVEDETPTDAPPAAPPPPAPSIKPKPSIQLPGSKKPTISIGKGKLASQVTRPPISRSDRDS